MVRRRRRLAPKKTPCRATPLAAGSSQKSRGSRSVGVAFVAGQGSGWRIHEQRLSPFRSANYGVDLLPLSRHLELPTPRPFLGTADGLDFDNPLYEAGLSAVSWNSRIGAPDDQKRGAYRNSNSCELCRIMAVQLWASLVGLLANGTKSFVLILTTRSCFVTQSRPHSATASPSGNASGGVFLDRPL